MLDTVQQFRVRLAGRLSGELDVAVAPRTEIELVAVAIGIPGSSIAFDCAALTFIDGSGVNMLLHVAQRSGKRVRLVNLDPTCRRVFEILDLCETFGIDEVITDGERIEDGFD